MKPHYAYISDSKALGLFFGLFVINKSQQFNC